MEMKNKNILVTGGTGFVGSHLIEELIHKEAHIITTFQTLNPRSYFFTKKLDKKTTMINCDVTDFEKVFDIVTKCEVGYIFHLAAQPLVDVAYDNPKRTLYSNIVGTINILESCRLFPKIKGVIITSSDKAYGKLSKKGKYKETDSLRGDHPYEASKSSADIIAYSYHKTYGVPIVTTRFGNIYGEGDLNYSRIIPGIMKALIQKKILDVRSDGNFVRDYVYVKDVVWGYLLLAQRIDAVKGESFNFGSDDTLSVIQLIKKIENTLGKKIQYHILSTAKNEIPYQSLNYEKIRKVVGWRPRYHLDETLLKMYKWYSAIIGKKGIMYEK